MIQRFLFQLLEISVLTGIIILVLMLFSPILNKRYAAKWKCAVWFLLAVRLLLPVKFGVTEPLIQIKLPVNVLEAELQQVQGISTNNGIFNNQNDENNQSVTKDITNTQNNIYSQEKQGDAQYINSETLHPAKSIFVRLSNLLQNAIFWNYISNVIFVIWLMGALIFAIYHSISYRIYRKNILRWGSKCTNKSWMELASEIANQMHLKRIPDIVISKYASSPMILGLTHPKLIMPEEYYTKSDLIFIFQHELTHYKRKDVWYKLILLCANAMHWFNPAVYMMFREASGDLECSCDDRVMQNISAEGRSAYTEIIFNYLLRQKINERSMSTYFYGGKKNMKNRFENIMSIKPKKQGKGIMAVLICTCLCLGSLVSCSSQNTNEAVEEAEKQVQLKQEEVTNLKNAEQKKIEEQNQILEAVKEEIVTEKAFVELVTSPPAMRLQDSLSSTLNYVEINVESATWSYQKEEKNSTLQSTTTYTSEFSPLNPEKQLKYLKLQSYNKIDYTPYSISFTVMPSSVTIKEYASSDMGNQDAKPLSEETYEEFISVPLKQGRIYEVLAVWEQGDFEEYGFYGEAHYGFATEDTSNSQQTAEEEITAKKQDISDTNYQIWTKEEVENMEQKNARTVTLLALIKERVAEEDNYFVISSRTDEFPGAFVAVVKPEVYVVDDIESGGSYWITMEVTDEMYGKLPFCNCIEMIPE